MNQYCKNSEVVDPIPTVLDFVDKKSVSGICFYRVQTDSLILNNILIKWMFLHKTLFKLE